MTKNEDIAIGQQELVASASGMGEVIRHVSFRVHTR